MKKSYYSKFGGIDRTTNQVDADQITFLKLDNYIPNRVDGAIVKRGGSKTWATTGNVLGLGSYSKAGSSYFVPNTEVVWRHRRNGSTSTIERYNTSTDAWDSCTLGANTSFGPNGIMQFDQIDTTMMLLGGRPAFTTDITSVNINRLGGPAPTTAPTWGTGAGVLTGASMGFYTFYNSTTGWESSPSPVTALTTLTGNQINWSGLETSCAKEGVDQKRLYRTTVASGGLPPYYRVTTVSLATTTYSDNNTDATISSNATGPEFLDHNPPPTDSYVGTAYGNRFWIASGSELYYSKVYDGTSLSLEYYSPDRVFRFPHRITGLAYTPAFGRLLVFMPAGRGIYYISGLDDETFTQDVFNRAEGTNFPSSVSYHEEFVCFWGNRGPTLITPQGTVTDFGRPIFEQLRESAVKEYNGAVYIWSEYHPVAQGFIFGYSATDSATSLWEDAGTGLTVSWTDPSNGGIVGWQ